MKNSFIIHNDSLGVLDDLTDPECGELFRAIKSYQIGEEMELSPMVKIAFSPFRNQFQRDQKKYDTTCKARADAGSKGGKQKVANLAKGSKSYQKVANLADSVNGSDSKSGSESDLKDLSTLLDQNVKCVFDYWIQVMNKGSTAKFTPKRKACIKARLKQGYTVNQIKDAIDGCRSSDHHMGRNDGGTVYDDLTLICRAGDKLESFIDMKNPPITGKPNDMDPELYKI